MKLPAAFRNEQKRGGMSMHFWVDSIWKEAIKERMYVRRVLLNGNEFIASLEYDDSRGWELYLIKREEKILKSDALNAFKTKTNRFYVAKHRANAILKELNGLENIKFRDCILS